MSETRPYLYGVSNVLSCAVGISDYSFSCIIFAENEDVARDWGITVAIEYAAKFGFPPHDLKPTDNEIISNSSLVEDPNPQDADLSCSVGEFPKVLQH